MKGLYAFYGYGAAFWEHAHVTVWVDETRRLSRSSLTSSRRRAHFSLREELVDSDAPVASSRSVMVQRISRSITTCTYLNAGQSRYTTPRLRSGGLGGNPSLGRRLRAGSSSHRT